MRGARMRSQNPGLRVITRANAHDRAASELRSCVVNKRIPDRPQYDLGNPSTCSARYDRIKLVEIGAT